MTLAPLLLVAALLAGGGVAWADGGAVVAREQADGLVVTVFVSPVPLRAGPAAVRVLVQKEETEGAVLDAVVAVGLLDASTGVRRAEAAADRTGATNRLLYAAGLEIPAPGSWRLAIRVSRGAQAVELEVPVEAAGARPPALRFWGWLVLPLGVVAVFLLHQALRDREVAHPG